MSNVPKSSHFSRILSSTTRSLTAYAVNKYYWRVERRLPTDDVGSICRHEKTADLNKVQCRSALNLVIRRGYVCI